MGELILCNQMLAALPYYLEDSSLNIYSLEELSYYIEHNTCLLAEDFMCEELCGWIERELAQPELAKILRTVMKRGRSLSEFVECLLQQTGYCSRESRRNIVATLKGMEHRPACECCKIRADRYVENRKYVRGIMEYRKFFTMGDAVRTQPTLAGDVWHNLGTAYARLSFYDEALACYRNAYELNHRNRSLESLLLVYQCMGDSEGYRKAAEEYDIPEAERILMKKKYESALHSVTQNAMQIAKAEDFEGRLDAAFASSGETMAAEVKEILEGWKLLYQRNW